MLIDTEMHLLAKSLEKLLKVYHMKLEGRTHECTIRYNCPDRKENEMSRCCYLKIGLIFPNLSVYNIRFLAKVLIQGPSNWHQEPFLLTHKILFAAQLLLQKVTDFQGVLCNFFQLQMNFWDAMEHLKWQWIPKLKQTNHACSAYTLFRG